MDAVNVFISSKQAEFVVERAVLADKVRALPLLEPVVAEEWAPERTAVREVMLDRVRHSPIYVGLFSTIYSEPTELEYRAATENPYREILIYLKRAREEAVDPRLAALIGEFDTRHVVCRINDVRDLLRVFPDHLRDTVTRMIVLLQKLGEQAPSTRSERSALARRAANLRRSVAGLGFGNLEGDAAQALAARLSETRAAI